MIEEWRDVVGLETLYRVSDLGHMWALPRCRAGRPGRADNTLPGRLMSPHVERRTGYPAIWLTVAPKQRRCVRLHVVVAAAFLGPRPPGLDVRHIDGDHANVMALNLFYGTRSANELDKVRHGRNFNANKLLCPLGHDLEWPNVCAWHFERGTRTCRACALARSFIESRERRGQAHGTQREEAMRYYDQIMVTA